MTLTNDRRDAIAKLGKVRAEKVRNIRRRHPNMSEAEAVRFFADDIATAEQQVKRDFSVKVKSAIKAARAQYDAAAGVRQAEYDRLQQGLDSARQAKIEARLVVQIPRMRDAAEFRAMVEEASANGDLAMLESLRAVGLPLVAEHTGVGNEMIGGQSWPTAIPELRNETEAAYNAALPESYTIALEAEEAAQAELVAVAADAQEAIWQDANTSGQAVLNGDQRSSILESLPTTKAMLNGSTAPRGEAVAAY